MFKTKNWITLKKLKKDLQSYPEEILEKWLVPIVEVRGWPPKDGYDSEWIGVFRNKSISFWRSLRWEKQTLMITDSSQFIAEDRQILGQLTLSHLYDFPTPIATRTDNSKQRFDFLVSYLKENNEYPWPVCLVKINGLLMIADGCHRLVAYFSLLSQKGPSWSTKTYWIGTLTEE